MLCFSGGCFLLCLNQDSSGLYGSLFWFLNKLIHKDLRAGTWSFSCQNSQFFFLSWRQLLSKTRGQRRFLGQFSDPFGQLDYENQRTEEPDPVSQCLCLYFGIRETFPVSFQTWTLALSTLIPCRTKSVLFSIHIRTYSDTVSKEKIRAWRPAGRPNIFSQYNSSGLSRLAKKPT